MNRFPDDEISALYRVIESRRDVRSRFLPAPVPDEIIARLLNAAHHAPSVGFMQPWEFILIRDISVRRDIHENFKRANQAAAGRYNSDRRSLYDSLKLEGIIDAPIGLCVLCDETTSRGAGLGRCSMPETAVYSTVCAIQNLWLAARAEGVGVGWVSILDPGELREALRIPEGRTPVAYLCLGYVSEFAGEPEMETLGWQNRVPLFHLIHFDRYGNRDDERAKELLGNPQSEGREK